MDRTAKVHCGKQMKAVQLATFIGLLLSPCQLLTAADLDGAKASETIAVKTAQKAFRQQRSYRLHLPPTITEKPLPLLLVLHGAFSTPEKAEVRTQFSQLADEKNFIVAYPGGAGFRKILKHWNAGHCCGKAEKDGINDIEFLSQVIHDIAQAHSVDLNRVYMVGLSNGGMMTHRFAMEKSELIAGVAIVAGSLNSSNRLHASTWQPSPPTQPVPILLMHGEMDSVVPINGGPGEGKGDANYFASLQNASAFWNNHNKGRAPVETIRLPQWGHTWPGPTETQKLATGHHMKGYDAARVIWNFFQQ